MRLITQQHLNLIERLSVKLLELDLRLGKKPDETGGAVKIAQELSKASTGFPLAEGAQLPDGRYLHINFSRLELVKIKDGEAKVEKSFGSLGRVLTKFGTELWIRLSGSKTGLVEKSQSTRNAFRRLQRELTPGRLTEDAKRQICRLDKTPLLEIIRNHQPSCIRR